MSPSIKKNFAFSLAYEVLAFAIPLITAPYLSRILGPDGIGAYSYSYNVAYYFGMFATLGMLRYGTRSIASVRDLQATKDQLFWELFFTQLLTAGFALALYLVYLFLFGDSLSAIWILYILSTALDVTWSYIL